MSEHSLIYTVWSAEPDRLSRGATKALLDADELAVASISGFELACLAQRERILLSIPVRSWLERLSGDLRTVGSAPSIAAAAVALPASFPGDRADRIICATAVEHGWRLVTKDRRLRGHRHSQPITVW
jgi:PIN domain nuclease of toxin-antitoxin system